MSRVSPVPGRPAKEGKSFGGNFRNYSSLYELGWDSPVFGDDGTRIDGYANASKGQKPIIRGFLERDHKAEWFAAIADSGQKHILPYVPINPPGRSGVILFDDATVTVPADTSLIGELCDMLTDGATKEELERGEYRPATWTRLGKDRVRDFERRHGITRGAWFRVAVWLAQRNEEQVAARLEKEASELEDKKEREKNAKRKPAKEKPARTIRKRSGGNDGSISRPDDASVRRSTTDELLGADIKPDAKCGENELNIGGVDYVRPTWPADNRSGQLRLFGD